MVMRRPRRRCCSTSYSATSARPSSRAATSPSHKWRPSQVTRKTCWPFPSCWRRAVSMRCSSITPVRSTPRRAFWVCARPSGKCPLRWSSHNSPTRPPRLPIWCCPSIRHTKIGAPTSRPISQISQYPYHLVPSPRLGLWDGRHANIPWLQEAPDQISKVVWGSWAELHPSTAQKLGVEMGDVIRITSDQGVIEVKVYIYKGIHPDAVAVPLGQGHEEYGRYAKGRGVNPLKILSPAREAKTGELALYGTRVQLAKAGRHEKLVRMGGSESQVGRKLVATVTADVFRRTEGGGKDVA